MRGKGDVLDVTSVDSVEYGIVSSSLFHHTDKSRCEIHCSRLHVAMMFLFRHSFLTLHCSFSSISPFCECVFVLVLVFINNYLWEMK